MICEGIRVTENINNVLNQIVFEGNAEILEIVLKSHLEIISFQQESAKEFENLMDLAVELDRIEVLKVLNSSDIVISQSKSQIFYTNLAKKAMQLNNYDIFDYIAETRPLSSRSLVLSSILKLAVTTGHFHVIKRCAESNVTFMLLNLDQRFEALRLVALNDCEITTRAILKNNAAMESVRKRAAETDSPQNIAIKHEKWNVMTIYETLIPS